ncbi:uncharacterized protein FN964_016523 [Alca torda]
MSTASVSPPSPSCCAVTMQDRGKGSGVFREYEGEEPYSELYPWVCEGLSDSSKVIVFSFKGVSPVTATFPPQRRLPAPHQVFPRGLCHRHPHHRGHQLLPNALGAPEPNRASRQRRDERVREEPTRDPLDAERRIKELRSRDRRGRERAKGR